MRSVCEASRDCYRSFSNSGNNAMATGLRKFRQKSDLERKIDLLTDLAFGHIKDTKPDIILFDWSIGSSDPQMCISIGAAVKRYTDELHINNSSKTVKLTTSCEEASKAEKAGKLVCDIAPVLKNIVRELKNKRYD